MSMQSACRKPLCRSTRRRSCRSVTPCSATHGASVDAHARRASSALAVSTAMLLGWCSASGALPLAPLGPETSVGDVKKVGLPVEEVKDILQRDLEKGQYFVTGDLTPEIFADSCRFVDPTNDVSGLSRYLTALRILFDPSTSAVKLKSIKVTGPRSIEAEWQLGGYLQFPWHPRISPFSGKTVYTLNEEGIVQQQEQVWSISGLQALIESFTPSWLAPAP